MKNKLTQKRLKELLHYDPESGIFTWRVTTGNYKYKKGDIAGSKTTNSYTCVGVDGRLYQAHRLAWLYVHGYFPENDIDHINRIRDDNRIVNLRIVSRSCNKKNSNTRLDNTSGIVGVDRLKKTGKWRARIFINGKDKWLGVFKNLDQAVMARWEAEVKYNFPNCNTESTAFLFLKETGGI